MPPASEAAGSSSQADAATKAEAPVDPLIPAQERESEGLVLPLTSGPGFFTLPWTGGERVRNQLEGRAQLAASRLEEFERDSQAMAEQPYACAGVAFVTFSSAAEARQCLAMCTPRGWLGFQKAQRQWRGQSLSVSRAPEPSDIRLTQCAL